MAKKRKTDNENGESEKVVKGVHLSGEEVQERLLEAGSEDELIIVKKTLKLEGVPQGSIDGNISRLKKKGELIFQTAITERGAQQGKPSTVEVIVKDMKLPTIVDGSREVFDAGVNYGMKALIAGVRLAQELSQMGIAQASPVIRMATEMRKAEGVSAQEAGQRAAEDAVAGAVGYMSQVKSEKPEKADIATVPNPMQGILARAMEPALVKAMSGMMGMFGGQPAQTGEQPPQASPLPSGWEDRSKESQKGE